MGASGRRKAGKKGQRGVVKIRGEYGKKGSGRRKNYEYIENKNELRMDNSNKREAGKCQN